ncbi:MAG: DNA-directed RNA polymerase subunit D [Candidatus Woesearchaeota archaeon]
MKLKNLSSDNQKKVFEISDLNPGYVNTLRRIFSSEIPTMAIATVEFRKNSSALYDEIVAHRLGLLALTTDLKSYNLPKKGEEPSAATHTTFTLKAKGPKTVYASDLVPKDKAITPVHPKTIIVKLLEGQELELVATAHLGYGIEHSKWDASLSSYYFKPKIEVKSNKNIDKYPPQVIKGGKVDASLINTPQLIDACAEVSEDVKISYPEDNKEFVFTIESWGQLTPDQITEAGIKRFEEQISSFETALKKI